MLLGAGFVGGIVTGVVGGASLIAFPAMLAAGLPPIVANASSAVAMTPGNFIAGIADLERRPPWDRSLAGVILVTVVGGVAGAVLLLVTPERAFTAVVPLLIGLATILFAAPSPSGAGACRGRPRPGPAACPPRASGSCSWRRSRSTEATSEPR